MCLGCHILEGEEPPPSRIVSLRGAKPRTNLLRFTTTRRGLLRLPWGQARNDTVPTCHCEERSDEAIPCTCCKR